MHLTDSATPGSPGPEPSLPFLSTLRTVAERHGGRHLLRSAIGGLDWEEAQAAADGMSARLRDAVPGLSPRDRVLVQTRDDVAGLLSVLSVWHADCIPVLVEAETSTASLRALAKQFGARAAVGPGESPIATAFETTDYQELLARQSELTKLTDIAAIFMTSGSTGRQKGVVITHDGMRAAAEALLGYLPITTGSTIVSGLRFDFDYGFYQPLLGLLAGATTSMLGHLPSRRSALLRALADDSEVVLPIVPSFVPVLAAWIREPAKNVVTITSTGSPLRAPNIETLRGLFPNARIYSMYGLTECKRALYLAPELLDQYPDFVGQPIPTASVGFLDNDEGPVEPTTGMTGELFVSGPTLAAGYWNDPEATGERFLTFPRHGRVLRTGDLFLYDETAGFQFLGRNDDVVKVRDVRLSLWEVEDAIVHITGIDGVAAGVEGGDLVAEVTTTLFDDSVVLHAHIKERLEYRLWPDRVRIVDRMALTRRDKPRRPGSQGCD